uniref:Protein kinase domain-containing protein n=1 Tax=Caenorhabditis tropicalis TaxID=1561998 RepID=A0A1I7U1Y3_9PELO
MSQRLEKEFSSDSEEKWENCANSSEAAAVYCSGDHISSLPIVDTKLLHSVSGNQSTDQDEAIKNPELKTVSLRQPLTEKSEEEEIYYSSKPGDIVAKKYQVIRELGQGTFSTVYLAQHLETESYAALKISKSSRDFLESALKEIKILMKLSGDKHIIQLIEDLGIIGKNTKHIGFASELLGPDLESFFTAKQEFHINNVRKICKQLLSALDYMHTEFGLIHGDLKPDNIMLSVSSDCLKKMADFAPENFVKELAIDVSDPRCHIHEKLGDFGLSMERPVDLERCTLQVCTFRAPEAFLTTIVDTPIDLWSVGCIAFQLVTGFTLFNCDGSSSYHGWSHLSEMCNILGPLRMAPFQSHLREIWRARFVDGVFVCNPNDKDIPSNMQYEVLDVVQ